jgi:tetratricopeptide (TPR) repeat protein
MLDDKEKANDLTAWTWSLQASMYESVGQVRRAIELNLKGYELRLKEVPLKGGHLGGFEQNLGYNYNTVNQHVKALTWFEKSRDTWIAWNVKEGRAADWPIVTKKNMARCLVYLDQYDRAQELLDISIAEFKTEETLNWSMLA